MNKIASLFKSAKVKYNGINIALKASIWAMFCSVMQKGIGFITMPIFSRLLTTEEYGVYTVFFSWMNIFSVICTLKIASGAFNNGLIKFKEHKNDFICSIVGLTFVLTLTVMSVTMLLKKFIPKIIDIPWCILPFMFIYIFFAAVYDLWAADQRFLYKYRALVAIALSVSVLTPVLGILAVCSTVSYKAEARIISSVVVEMAAGIFLSIKIFKNGHGHFFCKEYWKYALKFNIPLIVHYLSTMVLMQSDTVMISHFLSKSDAGLYGIGHSIAMVSTIVNTSVNSSLLPYTYHSINNKMEYKVNSVSKKLLIMVGGINLFIMLLAPELLKIAAAAEYQAAIAVIPPLAGSVFFVFLYTILANVEFYYEKTKSIAAASIFAAMLNLGLNYIFIPKFGFTAAGYTTLISYILLCFFHMINLCVIHRKIISKDIYDYGFIVLISLVFTSVELVSSLTYKYIYFRVIMIILVLIFIIAMLIKNKDIIKINRS